MTSSTGVISFRDAIVTDRQAVRDHVYTIHLKESVRNETELKNQTED